MQIPNETRCALRGNGSRYPRCDPYGIIDRVVGIIADSLEYLTPLNQVGIEKAPVIPKEAGAGKPGLQRSTTLGTLHSGLARP
jgi:hypothetical protein